MKKKCILVILTALSAFAAVHCANAGTIEVSFYVLGEVERIAIPDDDGKIEAYTPKRSVANKVFAGWSRSAIPNPTDTCPELVDISNTLFTQSLTLYAVFAYPNGGRKGATEITYTDDFEGYTANISYKGQRHIINADNGLHWHFYDGNVSTTGAINGAQSAVLQENGYTSYDKSSSVTTGKLHDVSTVQWKAKLYKSNDVQMNVLYSCDSIAWNPLNYEGCPLSKTVCQYTVALPDVGEVYLRIYAAYNSNTYSSQHKLILDDFVITTKVREYFHTDYSTSDAGLQEVPTLAFDVNGGYKAIDTLSGSNQWVTLPKPQRGDIDFAGWKVADIAGCNDTFPANSRYLLNHNVTLQALWNIESQGEKADIIDWNHNGVTINMNGKNVSDVLCNGKHLTNGNYLNNSDITDNTYHIPLDTLTMGHDIRLDIQWESVAEDGTGNQRDTSIQYYRIPYIYDTPQAIIGDTLTSYDDIVVRSGKAVVASDLKVHNIHIYPDAELTVSHGVTLVCDTLYLRTRAFHAAQLDIQGTIRTTQTYYTYITTNEGNYPFALPFSSNLPDVRLTTGETPVYKQDWLLKTLAASSESEQQPLWQITTDSIRSCLGYMFHSLSQGYHEYCFPVRDITGTASRIPVCTKQNNENTNAVNTGWNYIVSPLPYTYVSTPYEPVEDMIKVAELREDNHTYWQHVLTTLSPATPFYYQARENGYLLIDSLLLFRSASTALLTPSSEEPDTNATQWIQLSIAQPDSLTDETSIYLHPDKFSTNYETGYDMPKIKGYAQYPMLYTINNGMALSFNALPDTIGLRPIALGYYTQQDATLTISAPHTDYLHRLLHIYLQDKQTQTITDLLETSYPFSTSAGETIDRFTLFCVFRTTETATHTLPNVNAAPTSGKCLHNGHLYIRRHNIIYDSHGRIIFRVHTEQ